MLPTKIFLYTAACKNLQCSRDEKDNHNGQEEQQNHGNDDIDWGVVRLLFSKLTTFQTHLISLNTQHLRHTDTELFTLNNGGDKAGHFCNTKAVSHIF